MTSEPRKPLYSEPEDEPVVRKRKRADTLHPPMKPCPICDGVGANSWGVCDACNGGGWLPMLSASVASSPTEEQHLDYWRHVYAGQAMQGMLASDKTMTAIIQEHLADGDKIIGNVAACAVLYADQLLAELGRDAGGAT